MQNAKNTCTKVFLAFCHFDCFLNSLMSLAQDFGKLKNWLT